VGELKDSTLTYNVVDTTHAHLIFVLAQLALAIYIKTPYSIED
jgi:hypothetical protein